MLTASALEVKTVTLEKTASVCALVDSYVSVIGIWLSRARYRSCRGSSDWVNIAQGGWHEAFFDDDHREGEGSDEAERASNEGGVVIVSIIEDRRLR